MNYHALDRPVRHLSVTSRRRPWIVGAIAVTLLAAAAAIAFLFWPTSESSQERRARAEAATQAAVAPKLDLKLPPPDAVRPLTPEEAVLANEERPFAATVGDAARPFTLSADAISRLRAIDCLTQAVYYEAASEGLDGGRAVAQVVLNRMRHPAYPNTVCGVVYQGSTRSTGCQFTFTCDGSLARSPSAYLWARSRVIAQEALAGRVLASVGLATHYHADYVLPYWADSLDKLTQVGRHIFYRLRGRLGSGGAFAQRHPGAEPTPVPATTSAAVVEEALKVTAETTEPLLPVAEEAISKPVLDDSPAVALTAPETRLTIDGAQGSLIVDGDAPPQAAAPGSKRRSTEERDCTGAARGGSVAAIRANDLRTGRGSSSC